MTRRKHRIVVEITFDKPVTAKQAKWVVQTITTPWTERPIDWLARIVKTQCKEFERVFLGELRVRGAPVPKTQSYVPRPFRA